MYYLGRVLYNLRLVIYIKNKNIILRYIKESDIADQERWLTTETEWCDWDAPWEEDDANDFLER